MAGWPPARIRAAIRDGRYGGLTTGLAPGFLQGNLVVVPETAAEAFEAFCRANPRSLPLVERGRPGDPTLRCAAGIDLRGDVPGYVVWEGGRPTRTVPDIADLWTPDLTAFVLGCWFANEAPLAAAGIRLRHVEEGVQGGLFRTRRTARPAGPFAGPIVMSMRPFAHADVASVAAITARAPLAHGAPAHVGDPSELGIGDLARPDFGEPLVPGPGETAMFWECGLTGQEALVRSGLPFFVTHRPGHMVLTDIRAEPSA
jgi:uncharacterized protein YcsI (UPF0317 family)